MESYLRYDFPSSPQIHPPLHRDVANPQFIHKDPVLFTGTIAENIAFGQPDVTLAQIKDAAKHANCDFINEMPYGLDTRSESRPCLFVNVDYIFMIRT